MLVVASNKKPKVGKPHTYKKLIKRRLKNKKTQFKRNEKYEMAKTILLNVKKQGNNHSSTAIVNIDHISSYASVAMWSFLKSRLEKHFPDGNYPVCLLMCGFFLLCCLSSLRTIR